MKMNAQLALLLAAAAFFAVTLVGAPYPREQWLQHSPTIVALPALAWAVRKKWLSTAAFACLVAMLVLHMIGARWMYSYVPYERFCDWAFGSGPHEWFGWNRNHYDRLVHFAFGLLMPLPLVETAMRHGGLSRRWALAWAVSVVAGVSAGYEVFEWLLAIFAAPEMAERYNGQQGDPWDAQKDMSLAIIGSLVATLGVARTTATPRSSNLALTPSQQGPSQRAPSQWRGWLSLGGFLLLCSAAAGVGAAFGPGPWYDALNKPSWNPPNWIFPLVWTPLYAMIAVAGWLLWQRDPRSIAMRLWFVQLVLNAAWTWIFFGQHAIGAALVDILALAATIGATIGAGWPQQRTAAALLVPYGAWVLFASALNFTFWQLN